MPRPRKDWYRLLFFSVNPKIGDAEPGMSGSETPECADAYEIIVLAGFPGRCQRKIRLACPEIPQTAPNGDPLREFNVEPESQFNRRACTRRSRIRVASKNQRFALADVAESGS